MLKVVGTLNIILAVLMGLFLVLASFVYPAALERAAPGLERFFLATLTLTYGVTGVLAPIYNGVLAWRERGERAPLPFILHLSNGFFLLASGIFILAGISVWAYGATREPFEFGVFFGFFVLLFIIVGSGYLLLLMRRTPSAPPTP